MAAIQSEIKLIMPCPIFYKSPSILLVGAGPTSSAMIQAAAVHVATVVAADGGFGTVCGLNQVLDACFLYLRWRDVSFAIGVD